MLTRTNQPSQEPAFDSIENHHGDIYSQVTDRILEQLAKGVVPWQSPSLARVGWPANFATKRRYQGVNVFLLASCEYQSPYFMTFLQAKELGGQVRKGERGQAIIKAGTYRQTSESKSRADEESERSERRYLRFYTVFNACQIDGIDFPSPPRCESYTESAMAERAKAIVDGMPNPPVIHEGRFATPHYRPGFNKGTAGLSTNLLEINKGRLD